MPGGQDHDVSWCKAPHEAPTYVIAAVEKRKTARPSGMGWGGGGDIS